MMGKVGVVLAAAALSLGGCQGDASSGPDKPGAAPAIAAACPSRPAVGQTGAVAGTVEVIEKGGTIVFIGVRGCPVRIFAPPQAAASCRRGGTASARGQIQEYDLFPTMETLFIDAKTVRCG